MARPQSKSPLGGAGHEKMVDRRQYNPYDNGTSGDDRAYRWQITNTKMIIGYRLLASITMLAAASLFTGCSSKPESLADRDLILYFRDHDADFETLRSMLNEDKQLATIYHDGSYNEKAISPARGSEYRHVLQRAGLVGRLVSSHLDQDSHRVDISAGLYPGKFYILKGYVFSTKELAPLKSTLDVDDQEQPDVGQSWYRRIEGNWYLYISNAGSD